MSSLKKKYSGKRRVAGVRKKKPQVSFGRPISPQTRERLKKGYRIPT